MRLDALAVLRVAGPIDRDVWRASLPEHAAFSLPDSTEGLYVRLHAEDGAQGWWGPIDASAAALIPVAASVLSAADPAWACDVAGALRDRWRHAHTGLGACASAAIELAAWDLAARRHACSVAEWIGVDRGGARAYASLLGIDADDPRRDEIAAAVTAAGYPIQKWRLGAQGLDRMLALTLALARAAAPAKLAIECDRAWDEELLAAYARRCEVDLAWIEEPLPPWRPVRHDPGIPLAAGEHAYTRHELAGLSHVRVRQPDATFLPGLGEMAGAIVDCRRARVRCAIHGNGLPAAVIAVGLAGAAGAAGDAGGEGQAGDEGLVDEVLVEHHLLLEPRRQGASARPTVPLGARVAPIDARGLGVDPRAGCTISTVTELRWR